MIFPLVAVSVPPLIQISSSRVVKVMAFVEISKFPLVIVTLPPVIRLLVATVVTPPLPFWVIAGKVSPDCGVNNVVDVLVKVKPPVPAMEELA